MVFEKLKAKVESAKREREYQQERRKAREQVAKREAEKAYDQAYIEEKKKQAAKRAREKVRSSFPGRVTMFADKYAGRMDNFTWFDEPKKKGKKKKSSVGWTWF
jgi:hypothetical protein